MLRVVARNLAENAIRYAGPGRQRDARRSQVGTAGVVLRVVDDGAGVDQADLRACSSASTAPTAPVRRAAPASGWRS